MSVFGSRGGSGCPVDLVVIGEVLEVDKEVL